MVQHFLSGVIVPRPLEKCLKNKNAIYIIRGAAEITKNLK